MLIYNNGRIRFAGEIAAKVGCIYTAQGLMRWSAAE